MICIFIVGSEKKKKKLNLNLGSECTMHDIDACEFSVTKEKQVECRNWGIIILEIMV